MSSIGIDFGTTNSTIVSYDKKKKKFDYFLEKDLSGKVLPYPSVVWYQDDKITVGRDAKYAYNSYSDIPGHYIIKSVKSMLGTNREVSIFGEMKKPYEIAGDIIKHLKAEARDRFQAELSGAKLEQAVFTIPVNFDGRKRNDLRKAAKLAGINIQTFIHEPFAAIIGYIFNNKKAMDMEILNNKYMLVFDWGGGTLDITVVKCEDKKFFEVGTSEITDMAGDKFDSELVNLCVNRFKDSNGDKFSEEVLEERLKQKEDDLLFAAERCKIELSEGDTSNFNVDNIIVQLEDNKRTYYDIDEIVSRSDFENCIGRYIDKAILKINEALDKAQITSEQIYKVLMTGGSSRIPAVNEKVREMFGSRVITIENSDTVIAEGAAVIAEYNWAPFLAKNIMVELSDGSFWNTFEKGMPLVQEKMHNKETFTCIDTRDKAAKLIIAEGYNENEKEKNLAIINVPTASPRPQTFDEVVATFDIDKDFILSVSGYSEYAGLRATTKIYDMCFGIEVV